MLEALGLMVFYENMLALNNVSIRLSSDLPRHIKRSYRLRRIFFNRSNFPLRLFSRRMIRSTHGDSDSSLRSNANGF